MILKINTHEPNFSITRKPKDGPNIWRRQNNYGPRPPISLSCLHPLNEWLLLRLGWPLGRPLIPFNPPETLLFKLGLIRPLGQNGVI
jgi:hypothetical protein